MNTDDVSSQEKLDQMLREGKITEEDYRRLSEAMAEKPGLPECEGLGATGRRRLCKSWKRRQIGGVCAGIADYFGIDPAIVRILAVAMALFPPTLLLALILYPVLCFSLPWDDPEAARESQPRRFPWRLAIWSASFLTILPVISSHFLMPHILALHAVRGQELPPIAIWAITISDGYQLYGLPWGILLSISIAGLGLLSCMIWRSRMMRIVCTVVFIGAIVLWILFPVAGGLYPLSVTTSARIP